MQADTLPYDSLNSRPLPKWLTDQKSGLTTVQPEPMVMRKDHSLKISFLVTSLFIILLVGFLTYYILKKHKNHAR